MPGFDLVSSMRGARDKRVDAVLEVQTSVGTHMARQKHIVATLLARYVACQEPWTGDPMKEGLTRRRGNLHGEKESVSPIPGPCWERTWPMK